MAKFPKVIHGPHQDGTVWKCLATAVMPCGKSINGTAKERSSAKARSRAENLCDQSVRGHLASCKKCPEDVKKRYG